MKDKYKPAQTGPSLLLFACVLGSTQPLGTEILEARTICHT